MRKLLFLFVALLATTTLFGQYYNPISVTDGTAADWELLPPAYVASATHTEGCSLDGLKSVKVYCDDNYLNILVEVNLDVVTDREWTPFHIFLNADGSAATGGYGDLFADADTEIMLETAIYQSGAVAYNPAVFKWWGEVGGSGFQWTDPDNPGTPENGWGAVVPEGSLPIGNAQTVNGIGTVEIQLLKELIPAQWADEFTIGFDIQQEWTSCGILPNAADDPATAAAVLAKKLRVQVCHDAGDPLHQDGLYYEITSNVEPYTVAVVDADADITMATIPETIEYYGTTFAVTSIGYRAFSYCSSLVAISIPNSVTSIGSEAFASCSSLTLMIVEKGNTVYDSRQNCNAIIETATNTLIAGCQNTIIPNSVTSIGSDAFYHCTSLASITIPNSVTSIEDAAFYGCSSLTSITIPDNVTYLGEGVFAHCLSLEYLSIPNSVKYYDEEDEEDGYTYRYYYGGFASILNCPKLKTLIVPADFFGIGGNEEDYQYIKSDFLPYLPEKLKSLTINAGNMSHRFGWDFINRNRKSLKHIDLGVTESIAEEAFTNFYNLESLVLPSHLETVPYMAVAECVKLKSISIPATVTAIEDRAFENCRMLSSVAFAENGALTRIGNWAFYNNHELTNLVIPEGVTEVGHAAFYGCTYLKEMTLPSTVQEIADNGFALCAKLQRMNVDALVPPTVAARTFEEVNRSIPVYVPDEVVPAYQAAPVWQEFNIQGKSNAPSALDDISSPISNNQKLLRDGQLLILRDGKTYTIMGAEIH